LERRWGITFIMYTLRRENGDFLRQAGQKRGLKMKKCLAGLGGRSGHLLERKRGCFQGGIDAGGGTII